MTEDLEYLKLVEVYKQSKSMTELEERLREIPLEVREAVMERFDAFLVRETLEFLSKSENALHKSIHFSDNDIDEAVGLFKNEEEFMSVLRTKLGDDAANIVYGSLDAYIKISNQISLDTVVLKLENSLYDEKRFKLNDFESWGRTSVSAYVREKLSNYMELNIYRNRGDNKFSDGQKAAIALIDSDLLTLVELKNMSNSLERAEFLSGLGKETRIKPENLGIDKEIMALAKKSRELSLDLAILKYDINEAQTLVVQKLFENGNIDKDKFLRQIADVDGFLSQLKNNIDKDSFSVTTKLLRDSLMDDMHVSEVDYKIDFTLSDTGITKISGGPVEKTQERWAVVVPQISAESLKSVFGDLDDVPEMSENGFSEELNILESGDSNRDYH